MSWKIFKEIGSTTTLLCLLMCLPMALSKSETELRNFTTAINPNCTFEAGCENMTTINLVHIRSDSKIDSLHFVWSFIGRPTLLMARTSLDSELIVDWSKFVHPDTADDVSILFSGSLYYSFGWSLLKVWVYNDPDDTARMDKVNETEKHSYDTDGFLWERQNDSVITSSQISLNFMAKEYKLDDTNYTLGKDGYFGIQIRMKNTEEYNDFLPFMLYSGNSSQVDISFNNVQLNFTDEFPYPPHPRIALTYAFVQGDTDREENVTMRIEKVITLDDEHSPGVFELYRLRTPILHHQEQSFFQWRPISYTSDVRDIPDSIDTLAYDLTPADNPGPVPGLNDTIIGAFYGEEMEMYLIQSLNISFGTQKDGFYNKSKHIAWSYTTGYGNPPVDRTSFIVMLVILVGLGIPVLIIAGSVIYILSKRLKKPRDDLLLED